MPSSVYQAYFDRSPLHALTWDWHGSYQFNRADVAQSWRAACPRTPFELPQRIVSELPVVASHRLIQKLRERSADLYHQLGPYLTAESLPHEWQNACDADVLTVDYAVIQDPRSEWGWDIRLVEFQAFNSVLASAYLLHQAYQQTLSGVADLVAWQTLPASENWLSHCTHRLRGGQTTALLEFQVQQRPTRFDLGANASLFGLDLLEPDQLALDEQERPYHQLTGQVYQRLSNRLILREIEEQTQVIAQLQRARCTWQNHPAWYFAVNKGLATQLDLKDEPKNVSARHWRQLALPATDLVAKHSLSFAGQDILMHVSPEQLDSLKDPQHWLVQPRYQSYPLWYDHDGAPLYAEIRLMMFIQRGAPPWTAMQILRWYRGDRASVGASEGRFGEGVSLLYCPP